MAGVLWALLILLLAVLALALITLLIALLCPVEYAASARITESVAASARISHSILSIEFQHAAGHSSQALAILGRRLAFSPGSRRAKPDQEKRKRGRRRKAGRRLHLRGFSRAFLRALRHDLAGAWHILKPREFSATGSFALEDPADTAELAMLLLAARLAWPRADLSVWPAFDCAQTDVTARISGRFVPIVLVFRALRFMFRKEVRKVLFHRHAASVA